MISIRVNRMALARANTKTQSWATRSYRDIVYKMFKDMLQFSAQFSGDFTSNWHIVSAKDALPMYAELASKGSLTVRQQPHKAGDPEAIQAALDNNPRSGLTFKPGDKVFFYNPTPLEFTGTTVTGEGGTKPLRPENVIGTGILLKTLVRRRWRIT